jgi:hypothetical protein
LGALISTNRLFIILPTASIDPFCLHAHFIHQRFKGLPLILTQTAEQLLLQSPNPRHQIGKYAQSLISEAQCDPATIPGINPTLQQVTPEQPLDRSTDPPLVDTRMLHHLAGG